MAKIAVLGYGVVGSGTVEVFYKNKKSLEEKAGQELDIKYILDLRDFPDSPYQDKFVKDFSIILNDPEISVVTEVIGGLKPAYDFVKSSLLAGKSVVTSNKELVAAKGAELLAIAKEKNVNFFFEASVGGGIPIIKPLHTCLSANEIDEIAGILNGTTNFILTKMYNDNMQFEDALKLAQELGYAEKDPTADIEGYDACRKICIIASLVFGKHVYPDSVTTKGISQVSLEDVAAADVLGCAVKLIACVEKLENGKILPTVMPMLVPQENIIAGVSDVFNAVLVYGDGIDQTMFYGRGAGKLPTASAVLGDVIESVKEENTVLSQTWESSEDSSFIADISEFTARWYFRVPEANKPADLEGVYCENGFAHFITEDKLSYNEAAEKAEKLSAAAYIPVLD